MPHTLTIEYGEDVLFSTGLTVEQFSDEARFLLAAKLYEIGAGTSEIRRMLIGRELFEATA